MTRKLRAWLPALVWAGVIFFLSSRAVLPGPRFPGFDKLAHAGAYAMLGALLAHAQVRSGLRSVWPLILGWAYGASDEIHQSYVPGRSPSAADWIADAVGVALGIFLFARWRARQSPVLASAAPPDSND